MTASTRPLVLVLGSVNVDATSYVERFPEPGETVRSTGYRVALGGKGANQAVAARLAGLAVDFVARTGDDAAADVVVAELGRHGVPTGGVERAPASATGVAQITVTAAGENTVVVSSGANEALDATSVSARSDAIAAAAVAVSQGEVPAAAITELAQRCAESGTRFLLNLAPPIALPAAVVALADPLVVNELEAAAVGLAIEADDPGAALPIVAGAVGGLCRSLVVTLGAHGVLAADASGAWVIAAPTVDAVDTTGAGDCFTGTLAAFLADGQSLRAAAALAVAASAISVQHRGTVDSYAARDEIRAFAAEHGLA